MALESNSIYDTGTLYDDIHLWKKNDMEFWANIISENQPKSVLELACGTGRLTPPNYRRDRKI